MQNPGGGAKIFLSIFIWYENILSEFHEVWIFFGILEFHSTPVPGIQTDWSLRTNDRETLTCLYISSVSTQA